VGHEERGTEGWSVSLQTSDTCGDERSEIIATHLLLLRLVVNCDNIVRGRHSESVRAEFLVGVGGVDDSLLLNNMRQIIDVPLLVLLVIVELSLERRLPTNAEKRSELLVVEREAMMIDKSIAARQL